jgi:hypothetical protein
MAAGHARPGMTILIFMMIMYGWARRRRGEKSSQVMESSSRPPVQLLTGKVFAGPRLTQYAAIR